MSTFNVPFTLADFSDLDQMGLQNSQELLRGVYSVPSEDSIMNGSRKYATPSDDALSLAFLGGTSSLSGNLSFDALGTLGTGALDPLSLTSTTDLANAFELDQLFKSQLNDASPSNDILTVDTVDELLAETGSSTLDDDFGLWDADELTKVSCNYTV
jgi:hypothetical protein